MNNFLITTNSDKEYDKKVIFTRFIPFLFIKSSKYILNNKRGEKQKIFGKLLLFLKVTFQF
ncbi:MAG: hypothetical protein COA66_16035 [Arcobacter sp.]|nr:MAG: hypothetical protein COA66_16035 [Arcobacter sp.]